MSIDETPSESSGTSSIQPKNRFKSIVYPKLSYFGTRNLQEKFFQAVYTRNISEISLCLKKGVDPNARGREFKVTPLHLLAERNDFILGFRLLQVENINVEKKTIHGYTPLHLTCLFNCKRFAVLLLKHGANPNATDRLEKTPLHLAVENRNYRIILNLLRYGSKVNVLDCFMNTPLSISINDVGNYLIAKTLIENGADDFKLEEHRSLHIFFETILNCRTLSQIDFVELLLDHSINVNMIDPKSGKNCLHYVAITGFIELSVILIERGAKRNVIDFMGRSPAKVALEHGNDLMADYLCKGYRPPKILKNLPLVYLWIKKMKDKMATNENGNSPPSPGSVSSNTRK